MGSFEPMIYFFVVVRWSNPLMATKKTTTRFDDLGPPLDDLDFDINPNEFDRQKAKQEKKRRPIMKVAGNFAKGSASHLASASFLRGTLSRMLPHGYGTVIDQAFELRDTASQLYNTASTEYRKLEPQMQRAIDRALPKGKLPISDKIEKKLRDYGKRGTQTSSSPAGDQEWLALQAEIEQLQLQNSARNRREDIVRDGIKQEISSKRFKLTNQALASIDARLARQNAFNDKVFSYYQRRALELQYKQYSVQRETQRTLAMELAQSRQYLQAIVHNTGLPDTVKTKAREKYGEGLRERFSAISQQAIVEHTRNLFRNTKD